MKQKTLFIAAAAVLALVFLGATLVYKNEQGAPAPQPPAPPAVNLLRMHAPALGRADAPVVIVEFFDPACETCSAFYPLVKQILAAHPDRVRLVLRYAPFHKGSDKVVAILEAARKQDRFWQALEALLASQAQWSPHHTPQIDLVWKQLQGLGLNFEQMQFDLTAPEIASVIAQDIDDARALNVTKTPEYFVNGRPLPSFGFEQLKKLVDDALAASAR